MKKKIETVQRLLMDAGYIAPTVANIVGSGLPINKAVVAFAANDDGEVIGYSVAVGMIETDFSEGPTFFQDAIRLLEGKFGTPLNYLLVNDELVEANGRELTPLASGISRQEDTQDVWHIFDPELVGRIMRDELQKQKKTRGFVNYFDLLETLSSDDDLIFEGRKIFLAKGILFAMWKQMARADKGSGSAQWLTSPDLNAVLTDVALTSKQPLTIFDPFLGVGDTLVSLASKHSGTPKFQGWEINRQTFANAKIFLNNGKEYGAFNMRLDESNVELLCVDSFKEVWPRVDLIISSPPIGIRLTEPCLGPSFVTRDGEVAAIDKAINALNDGGRAVLLTSRGWTFRAGDSAKLRDMISSRSDINVTALIGLPSILPGTSIEPCIVVIDRIPKADTLVAELGADWKEQLQVGGPIWSELRGQTDA
jgi:hypothetical protein